MRSDVADEVDDFIAGLDHPLKAEVVEVRRLILGADPEITEQIKWKAPSFCFAGDDRITMNLRKQDELQLVFHRGAKVKDATDFEFEDPSGLMQWKTEDRGIVVLRSGEVEARSEALTDLAARWVRASAD